MGKYSGLTLIELLIAVMISAIAMFGLALPLISGKLSTRIGFRQTEAQRDAQLIMQAIARRAHERSSYIINGPGNITFATPCGTWQFQKGGVGGSQFLMTDCSGSPLPPLIDGKRSQLTNFTVANVGPVGKTRLVRVNLTLVHQLGTLTDNRQETETLLTDLYLHNAS